MVLLLVTRLLVLLLPKMLLLLGLASRRMQQVGT
jgi:hypothetical protein